MHTLPFLKQLTLHGFKAFRNKTIINFRNGVAAFAGPNGCGKSNIIDALRWVMGEKKFSDLRGNKMDDLIFFGGSEKNASNFAEVALTFNNLDGFIALDYKEITIMRRVYRSGESECFINGTPCRLKDITDLVLPLFGKSNYSIVAQGRIEEVSAGSSESRREVIETIAGIAAFNEKKKEYERRIDSSKQNLKRVSDILRNMETQKQHLARQAENSSTYFKLKAELKDLELLKEKIAYKKIKTFIIQHQDLLEKLRKDKKNIEKDIAYLRKEKTALEERIQVSREKILTLEKEKIKSSSQNTINIEKAKMHERLIDAAQQKVTSSKSSLTQTKENKKSLLKNIEENSRVEKEHATELEKLKAAEKELSSTSNKNTQKKEELQASRNDLQKKITTLLKNIESRDEEIDSSTQNILKKLKDVSSYIVKQPELGDKQSRQKTNKKVDVFLASLKDETNSILKLLQHNNSISIAEQKQLHSQLEDFFKNTLLLKDEFIKVSAVAQPLLEFYEKRLNIISTIEKEKKEVKQLQEKITDLEKFINDASNKNFQLQKHLHEISLKKQKVTYNVENAIRKSKTILQDSTQCDKAIKYLDLQILEEEEKLKKLLEEQNLALNDKQSQEDYELQAKKKIEQEELVNRGLFQRLNEAEQKLNTKSAQEHHKQEEVVDTSNKVQLLKNDLDHLKKNIQTIFNENIEKYENNSSIKLDALERNISLIKLKIDKMGRINPLAEEEYSEIKAKSDQQQQEKNDVLSSIEDLFQLSKSLEEKSRITFQEIFSLVNQHFSVFINELFPGSSGLLSLANPKDPLKSGVEISVELRGKKMRKMDLFSGGEKTLIALAFIFALFLTRKTPFCILDEVDAALDNENISRFINLINKHSHDTQFILISHNQNTFSAIDYVYGISMQNGISQIFSLKIPELVVASS